MDTIQWVIATGMIILGGVVTINRVYSQVYRLPPVQEQRLPFPPTAR
ncbi:MAG: hypothetical protein HQL86_03715 [Magnetococcales bacterium]|nr:hypothetical protein [Magnetococcales bacterium]